MFVVHHVHPEGYGGDDGPENRIHICASCHDVLHKIAEAFYAGKMGKGQDLAQQYLPNEPAKRTRLLQLSNKASQAKKEWLARTGGVPDIDDTEETVSVQLDVPKGLHHRLKTLAYSHSHRDGRRTGLYKYILEVLKNHALIALNSGGTASEAKLYGVEKPQKEPEDEKDLPLGSWDFT
jgi:hypothetical protein